MDGKATSSTPEGGTSLWGSVFKSRKPQASVRLKPSKNVLWCLHLLFLWLKDVYSSNHILVVVFKKYKYKILQLHLSIYFIYFTYFLPELQLRHRSLVMWPVTLVAWLLYIYSVSIDKTTATFRASSRSKQVNLHSNWELLWFMSFSIRSL